MAQIQYGSGAYEMLNTALVTDNQELLISGNVNIGNIVTISGNIIFDLGSPGLQQLTYIISSGTYVSEVWSPGLGSRVEIHGWEISSDVPQEVRLVLSGTAGGFVTIGRYRLPASGTILKTLVHPITPGVENEGLGLGTTVTGSTDITIYGRDKI